MSSTPTDHEHSQIDNGASQTAGKPLARWQITLLTIAGVVMLIGAGLWAYSAMTADEAPVASNEQVSDFDRSLSQGIAPSDNGGTEDPDQNQPDADKPFALENYSPALFRLGFSFFVGFAIAYALRSFLKITIIAIGLMLLGLFGLQYAGVVTVDWAVMEQYYNTSMEWLKEQTAGFSAFIQGYLPSAASAAGGFVIGFRRRG